MLTASWLCAGCEKGWQVRTLPRSLLQAIRQDHREKSPECKRFRVELRISDPSAVTDLCVDFLPVGTPSQLAHPDRLPEARA